jgi:NAD(P)-dependent dehydrogenase (short-subunit alcohol dehydrogenase family)
MLTMSLLVAYSGIGAAIVNQLAKQGANVVVN